MLGRFVIACHADAQAGNVVFAAEDEVRQRGTNGAGDPSGRAEVPALRVDGGEGPTVVRRLSPQVLVSILQPENAGAFAEKELQQLELVSAQILPLVDYEAVVLPSFRDGLRLAGSGPKCQYFDLYNFSDYGITVA